MATIESTATRSNNPSMPLITMGGSTAATQPATATSTMTLTAVPSDHGTDNAEVLRLTLRARPTVRWDENVEDNEGLGRKSSKRCCIFHKQRDFGESSTDSSADEQDDADNSNSGNEDKKPKASNNQRRKIARPKKKPTDVPDYQRFHA